MTEQELKKLQKEVDNAGSPFDTRRVLHSGAILLENDNERLTHAKNALRLLFSQKLGAWQSVPVDSTQVPFTIAADIRRAQHYISAAYGCVALESLLAAWIFHNRLNQPPIYGGGMAVLCALLVHGSFLMLFRNTKRPKEEADQITSLLLKPALWLFGLSFVVLLLARTLHGSAAALMVNVLNISLWTSTVGLMSLAGALFAGAFILRWSRHDDYDYRALGREQAANNSYVASFKDQLKELDESPPLNTSVAPAPQPKTPPISSGAAAALMLVLALFPLTSSCSSNTIVTDTSDEVGRELVISCDFSGSPDDPAYAIGVGNLRASLPRIVEQGHFTRIRVIHFGSDGWIPEGALNLPLPKQKIVQVKKDDGGEVGGLENIRQALEEEAATQVAIAKRSNMEIYRQSMLPTLSEVSDAVLLPPKENFSGSQCTDLNGHLQYIRHMSSSQPIVVLLLTDGGENCIKKLESVERPDGDVSLAIILLPEKMDQLKSVEKIEGHRQYKDRKPRISAAVPWAVVSPYFNEDLNGVVAAAIEKYKQVTFQMSKQSGG